MHRRPHLAAILAIGLALPVDRAHGAVEAVRYVPFELLRSTSSHEPLSGRISACRREAVWSER